MSRFFLKIHIDSRVKNCVAVVDVRIDIYFVGSIGTLAFNFFDRPIDGIT